MRAASTRVARPGAPMPITTNARPRRTALQRRTAPTQSLSRAALTATLMTSRRSRASPRHVRRDRPARRRNRAATGRSRRPSVLAEEHVVERRAHSTSTYSAPSSSARRSSCGVRLRILRSTRLPMRGRQVTIAGRRRPASAAADVGIAHRSSRSSTRSASSHLVARAAQLGRRGRGHGDAELGVAGVLTVASSWPK